YEGVGSRELREVVDPPRPDLPAPYTLYPVVQYAARQDHPRLQRVQESQLLHHQEQAASSGARRVEEVLPALQLAHAPQGNEVAWPPPTPSRARAGSRACATSTRKSSWRCGRSPGRTGRRCASSPSA